MEVEDFQKIEKALDLSVVIYIDLQSQIKAQRKEIEYWKDLYYKSTTEAKANLINEVEKLKIENEGLKQNILRLEGEK